MLEAAVDGLGWAVAGAGMVEEREDVIAAFVESPAELSQLDQGLRDTCLERVDHSRQRPATSGAVLVAVRGDDALVDAPGDFNLGVILTREQRIEACVLPSLDIS